MLILHRGKIKKHKDGFVLLRGLISMFIVMICFAGILSSLALVSNRGSAFREEVYKEIEKRNIDTMRDLAR